MSVDICTGCRPSVREFIRFDEKSIKDFLIAHGVISLTSKCSECNQDCSLSGTNLGKAGKKSDCQNCGQECARCSENSKNETKKLSNYDKICVNDKQLFWRCQKLRALPAKRKKKMVKCNFKMSFWKNTFFAGSHLEIRDIVDFIALFITSNTPKNIYLEEEFEYGRATVVGWGSFIREVLLDWAIRNNSNSTIGGVEKIVEVKVSKLGRPKYNQGVRIQGQWVFGGIERGTKKSFIVPVESRDRKTLMAIAKTKIAPGTKILSEFWKSCDDDSLPESESEQEKLDDSENLVDPVTGANTENIQHFKSAISKKGCSEERFTGYLAEFLFVRAYPDRRDRIHQIFLEIATLYNPAKPAVTEGEN